MNTAASLLGISQLEALRRTTTGLINEDYIKIGDELVTIKDLCDFWVEGHEKLKSATTVLDEAIAITEKYLGGNSERSTEKEKELQAEQKVEGIQTQEECGTKGDRSNNKKETVQGSESTSQKPKRRGVRKS